MFSLKGGGVRDQKKWIWEETTKAAAQIFPYILWG